jgi:phosphoribosylanthranilate isomerase
MFRIKICGITTIEDAQMVAAAGADAIGLNFYPQSPRFVTPRDAAEIAGALPPAVLKVGVFVNSPAEHVRQVALSLQLDAVQLHGDESPEFLRSWADPKMSECVRAFLWNGAGRTVCIRMPACVKAFRLGPEGLGPAAEYLERSRQLECLPDMVLVDAAEAGKYGGTGRVADWSQAARYPLAPWHPPLVLAGGLTPENVAEAIRAVHPYAVDTASGVESSPGRKDPALVKRFVAAAKAAFEQTPRAGT